MDLISFPRLQKKGATPVRESAATPAVA